MEQMASQQARPGDLLYGSVWVLPEITVLGCSAPIKIPLSWKAEIIGLRKVLRRRIAKQKRPLNAEDLLRYADEIRATYLLVRDSFDKPPRLSNTDGDPLVFYTLTFQIESPKVLLRPWHHWPKGIPGRNSWTMRHLMGQESSRRWRSTGSKREIRKSQAGITRSSATSKSLDALWSPK